MSLKLSAIKLDSRFTTSAQMIKLMSQFEVGYFGTLIRPKVRDGR